MMLDKKYPSDLTDEEWKVVKECLRREEETGAGRARSRFKTSVGCDFVCQ